jgi:hypothetical protein
MNRFPAFLIIQTLVSAAFATEPNPYVGIWAVNSAKNTDTGLCLFPSGKANFIAICGSAEGTWTANPQNGGISVLLSESSSAPFATFTFQLKGRDWLIRTNMAKPKQGSPAPVASLALVRLQKSPIPLPVITP